MNNSGLFKYKLRIIILKNLILYKKVIKFYYNNSLIKYYKIKKILEFFKRF
jgi:hypothetical protein